jgi:diamine N-acetyltransferase
MRVTLEPVGPQDREKCIALEVTPEQRSLIATNERSLSQASANPACVPMAIRCDGELVGFLMYEPRGNRIVSLHRFMIDRRRQRQGIGREAMRVLVDRLREAGFETIYLSFRPENSAARGLYDGLGFHEHEIEADGEVVYRLGPLRDNLSRMPGRAKGRSGMSGS